MTATHALSVDGSAQDTLLAENNNAAPAAAPIDLTPAAPAGISLPHGFQRLARAGRFAMTTAGVAAVSAAALLVVQPGLRQTAVVRLQQWDPALQQQAADNSNGTAATDSVWSDTDYTVTVASNDGNTEEEGGYAINPKTLSREQASVAYWISGKYRVAPEAIGLLVKHAYTAGQQEKLDPLLLLAVMAVESSFNPYAQSSVGAQGLMQVMTHIHADKYEDHGGKLAAFDPETNVLVGAKVLKDTIRQAGSVRGGLRYYVGAANLPSDQGYGDKVLGEYARLQAVARGNKVEYRAELALPAPLQAANTKTAAPATPATAEKPAIDTANIIKTSHSQPKASTPVKKASSSAGITVIGMADAPAAAAKPELVAQEEDAAGKS